ncbi:hypothetical protein BJV78DRAFT_148333 [Lactifluus subvellereus]|nr:hypothetical protein BJV78DRAFT_148333 [Lactifluus subvellereus]
MSRLAVVAPLLLLSGIAVAQMDIPKAVCSQTWQWTSNSLGRNPCHGIVAVFLMATCNGDSFYMSPLKPGDSYIGPTGDDDRDGDLCKCNTVVYSLLSACFACQQEPWITYVS